MTFGIKISLDADEIEDAIKRHLIAKGHIVVCSQPTYVEFFTDYGSVKPSTLTAIVVQTRDVKEL